MKITDAYLAGFFDGEGSVLMRQRNARPGRPAHIQIEAHVTNNNLDILISIQKKYGGQIAEHQNTHRMCNRLRWTSKDSIKILLDRITPFLILKKPHANLMLKYIKTRPSGKRSPLSGDEHLFQEKMTELNKELRFR